MPRLGRVYVNRTLNMKRIGYIGLDMDHTIIRYHSDKFEELAHKSMINKLIEDYNYPTKIKDLKFDYNLAIRGLVVNKAKGNLLKLSRYSAIRESFHGLSRISYSDQKKMYKSPYIDLNDENYDAVDTTFSISFATLFAQLVELKDTTEVHTLPEYSTIADQLIQVLDTAHTDGTLKDYVRDHLDQFIIKDPEVVAGLETMLSMVKKYLLLLIQTIFIQNFYLITLLILI